jgi:hypothetical protein
MFKSYYGNQIATNMLGAAHTPLYAGRSTLDRITTSIAHDALHPGKQLFQAQALLLYGQEAGLTGGPGPQNLLINLLGAALFGGLFKLDSRGAEQRVQQRKAIREAQIRAGDREVFVNDAGETMSRLKEVGGCSVRVRGGGRAAAQCVKCAQHGLESIGVCEQGKTRRDKASQGETVSPLENGGWSARGGGGEAAPVDQTCAADREVTVNDNARRCHDWKS